jgi:hypothetical protein
LHPAFVVAETHFLAAYRAGHAGLLPATPFVVYVERRYELDPERFTAWHPRLGRWIAEDVNLRAVAGEPPVVTGPTTTTTTTTMTCEPPPGGGGVPEPPACLLLSLGIVLAWVWKGR